MFSLLKQTILFQYGRLYLTKYRDGKNGDEAGGGGVGGWKDDDYTVGVLKM